MTRLALFISLALMLIVPVTGFAQEDNPFLARNAWRGCTEDELLQFAAEVYSYSIPYGSLFRMPGGQELNVAEFTVMAWVMPDENTPATNCDDILIQRQFLATHAMSTIALFHLPMNHIAFEPLSEWVVNQTNTVGQLLTWAETVLPQSAPTVPISQPPANAGETMMYVRFPAAVVRGCPSRSCAVVRTAPTQVIVNGSTEGEVIDGSSLWYEVTVPNYRTPAGNVVTGYMHESTLSANPP